MIESNVAVFASIHDIKKELGKAIMIPVFNVETYYQKVRYTLQLKNKHKYTERESTRKFN